MPDFGEMPDNVPKSAYLDTYVETFAELCEEKFRTFKGQPTGRVTERRVLPISSKAWLAKREEMKHKKVPEHFRDKNAKPILRRCRVTLALESMPDSQLFREFPCHGCEAGCTTDYSKARECVMNDWCGAWMEVFRDDAKNHQPVPVVKITVTNWCVFSNLNEEISLLRIVPITHHEQFCERR